MVLVMTSKTAVPFPDEQPLLDLMDAGSLFGMGRTTAYALAASEKFPVEVLKVGGRLKVRTADVRRYFGLPVTPGTGPDP